MMSCIAQCRCCCYGISLCKPDKAFCEAEPITALAEINKKDKRTTVVISLAGGLYNLLGVGINK